MVTLSIESVNDTPLANDDFFSTIKNESLTGNLSFNDTPGDGVTVYNVLPERNAQFGSLDLNSDGSFSYLPDEDFIGTDEFEYQITDQTRKVLQQGYLSLFRPYQPMTMMKMAFKTSKILIETGMA